MLPSREFELAAIDAWILEHGVSRCPTMFAARALALPYGEIARRLSAFRPEHFGREEGRALFMAIFAGR